MGCKVEPLASLHAIALAAKLCTTVPMRILLCFREAP